jgi:hypothetical protein
MRRNPEFKNPPSKPSPLIRGEGFLSQILPLFKGGGFRWGVILVLLILSLPFPLHAQDKTSGFFSGNYLMALCQSNAKGKETVKNGHAVCQSYIAGMIDYHKLMKSLGTAPTIDFCVPNTTPPRRLQKIVYVYLAKNRQHGDFTAAPAVALALYEYYPCKPPVRKRRR